MAELAIRNDTALTNFTIRMLGYCNHWDHWQGRPLAQCVEARAAADSILSLACWAIKKDWQDRGFASCTVNITGPFLVYWYIICSLLKISSNGPLVLIIMGSRNKICTFPWSLSATTWSVLPKHRDSNPGTNNNNPWGHSRDKLGGITPVMI